MEKISINHISIAKLLKWCPRPDSNRHSASGKDFKSFVSTNSTTRAHCFVITKRIVYKCFFNDSEILYLPLSGPVERCP